MSTFEGLNISTYIDWDKWLGYFKAKIFIALVMYFMGISSIDLIGRISGLYVLLCDLKIN